MNEIDPSKRWEMLQARATHLEMRRSHARSIGFTLFFAPLLMGFVLGLLTLPSWWLWPICWSVGLVMLIKAYRLSGKVEEADSAVQEMWRQGWNPETKTWRNKAPQV